MKSGSEVIMNGIYKYNCQEMATGQFTFFGAVVYKHTLHPHTHAEQAKHGISNDDTLCTK